MCKISIVTINYDNLNELKKTIKSIDNQKIKPFRHIVVSKKLKLFQIKKYRKKYREFILDKDNSLFNAMNIGKKYSLNCPLIFLNSGDIFYNKSATQFIKKYCKNLKNNEVVIFKTVLKNKNEYFYPKNKYFKNKNYLPHSSFIFFNSKDKSKINFDEKMPITADGKWMREILKKSNKLIKDEKFLVIQNLDGQSSTPTLITVNQRLRENFVSGLKEIVKLLIKLFLSKRLYFRLIYLNKYYL